MDTLANSSAAAVKLTLHFYNCAQQGHVKANCPKKSASQNKAQGQGNVNSTCDLCGKPRHANKVCKSKYHINGQLLKKQGNEKLSAEEDHVTTKVFSHTPAQAFVTSLQQGQEGQLARIFTPQPQKPHTR